MGKKVSKYTDNNFKILSEDKNLFKLFDASPIGIGISSLPDFRILYINQRNEHLLGISRDKLIGKNGRNVWVDLELREKFLKEFLETGRVKTQEVQLLRNGKEPFWCLLTWETVRFSNEDCLVFWTYDITELKLSGEMLEASEQRLMDFADTASDWFWEMDENLRFTYFSARNEEVTGLGFNEFLGKSRWEISTEIHGDPVWIAHKEDLDARRPFKDFDYELNLPDSVFRYVSINGAPVFDDANKFTGYRGTGRDITERKRAEQEIAQYQNQLEELVKIRTSHLEQEISDRRQAEHKLNLQTDLVGLLQKSASDANNATNFEDALQMCLDTICSFTGWPVGHVYLRPESDSIFLKPSNIWHLDDPERFAVFREITDRSDIKIGSGLVSRVFEYRKPQWVDNVSEDKKMYRVKFASGDVIVRSGFALPVLSQDNVVAVLEFYSDKVEPRNDGLIQNLTQVGIQLGRVFERQQSEDKLKQLNDQKDKFFSIIAHDLKSPFNALLGYSSLLSSGAESFDQIKVTEYSNAVNESANQVFKLLENLLEWARLQMGQLEFKPGTVDLKEIIDTNLELFAPIANEKSIKLISKRKKGITVFADTHMVDTIIRNLVNNAIKFTPEKGHIFINARKSGSNVEIEIADTGVGISKNKASLLFQLDEKTSTLGTGGETGTGLGLHLCKELVEKQGGQITVESIEGEGTVFSFTLPKAHQ